FCLCLVLLCIRAEEVAIPVDLNHTTLVCPTRTGRTIAHFPFGPRGSMVSGRQMYIVGIEPDSVPRYSHEALTAGILPSAHQRPTVSNPMAGGSMCHPAGAGADCPTAPTRTRRRPTWRGRGARAR